MAGIDDTDRLRAGIAFLDIEASGLMKGSFPVEAAWITGRDRGEMLVCPDGFWDESRWDPDAQAMHGISLVEARRKGRHPRIVAAALAAAFRDRVVFSDSPVHDAAWADMLHAAGGVPRHYRIESVGRLLGHLGIKAARAYAIFEEARAAFPPRGRARAGAAHLEAVFESALRDAS